MKRVLIFIMLLFLIFAVGCDFSDIKPVEEDNGIELGKERKSVTIKASADEFNVGSDTNPTELIEFIKKNKVDDDYIHVDANVDYEYENQKDFSATMDLMKYIEDKNYKVYNFCNIIIDNINLSNETYQDYIYNNASETYVIDVYKKNNEVVAGGNGFYTNIETIKDLPLVPGLGDGYDGYYNYFLRFCNSFYSLALYPKIIIDDKFIFSGEEYSYNKDYEITIYENYTLLKIVNDLGIINLSTYGSNIIMKQFLSSTDKNNAKEETLIYINNNTGLIDKTIYRGKSFNGIFGTYFEYDISIVRKEFSLDLLQSKKELMDEYVNGLKN